MRSVSRAVLLALAVGVICSGALYTVKAAEASTSRTLNCDESMKTAFRPDSLTTVLLVKHIKKGDPYPNPTMEQLVYPKIPATFEADLCLVKLLVGPSHPGPTDAPSTSQGIGIEVWLPEKRLWNHRFHAIGGSGSTGSEETVLDKVSSWTGGIDTRSAQKVAAEEGAVTSTTDSGKGNDRSTSFLMDPDGTVNNEGLTTWKYRALYEQAVKTKALATAYYGTPPKYSYFDGASGGGRQAFHIAQNLPEQYDGIVAGVAALNWNEMLADSYAALVIQRDLAGMAQSKTQLALVSNAAIAACDVVGGKHLGFVIDNRNCRYDPTKDVAVLCTADGGKNTTTDCLTRKQALAVNKFWYGITSDGSVPDPATDNGWDGPPTGVRRWYGLPRGSDLAAYAQPNGFSIGNDMMAVAFGDAKLGSPTFKNATGSGEDAWKGFSYPQFAVAFDRVRRVLPDVSANFPDLSAFKAHGGKFLNFTAVNDSLLLSQGAIDYYQRVAERMGGLTSVQAFYRLYLMPGLAHGAFNGTMNPTADPPVPARGQQYQLLVNWVEKGAAPEKIVFTSSALGSDDSPLAPLPRSKTVEKSLPVCAYPAVPTYSGGDIFQAASYSCR